MEARIEIKIDGAKGTAKGVQYQAAAHSTATGLVWVLQGELAEAVLAVIERRVAPPTNPIPKGE